MSSNRPPQGILYSPKSRSQGVRIREGDLFEKLEKSAEKQSGSNPSPSSKYQRYDQGDLTVTEHENSNNSRKITPTKKSSPLKKNYLSPHNRTPASASNNYQNSPSTDLFYTPLRGGTSSNEGSFVTPMTSQKPDRSRSSTSATPIGFAQGYEYRRLTQEVLDERLNRSFEKLKKAFGETAEAASNRAIPKKTELPGAIEDDSQSDKFSLLDSVENSPKSSKRSVDPKPHYVENVEKITQERVIMTKMKVATTTSTTAESKDMNYVQTLCCAMEMQRKYADEAEKMEKHLDQLDMLKKEVNQMESSSKNKEDFEERCKKIEFLKEKLQKVVDVKKITHEVQSVLPYVVEKRDKLRNDIFESFMWLDGKDFAKNVSKENVRLSKELKEAIKAFRIARKDSEEKKRLRKEARRQSGPRESIPLKIKPLDESTETINVTRKDVETQVTSRLDTSWKQSSPKKVEIEPLDFTGLELNQPLVNKEEEKKNEAIDKVIGSINLVPNIDLNQTQDESINLNMSIGENSFFNNSDISKRFETHYPSRPNSAADDTPRSARSSMDPASARRFSDGVAHFLEKQLKREEEIQVEQEQERKVEDEQKNVVEEVEDPENVEKIELEVEETLPETEKLAEIQLEEAPIVENVEKVEKVEEKDNIFIDDEGDETKRFLVPQEYEDDFENEGDEESSSQESTVFEEASINDPSFNESADDSGFLLNNKPAPRLKSILDLAPAASSSSSFPTQVDTPRRQLSPVMEDTSTDIDVDFVCRHDLLPTMTETMINKAIELQSQLKGCDWVMALDIWDPVSFLNLGADQPEAFESFWILVWGKVVGLINEKYLKFDVKMSKKMEEKFREEATSMVGRTFGVEAKGVEWHLEIQLSKKLQDLMIFGVDYRHEQRKNKPIEEQQMYRFTQLQMQEVALHYSREKLDAQIQELVEKNKEDLASFQLNTEIEKFLAEEDENAPISSPLN